MGDFLDLIFRPCFQTFEPRGIFISTFNTSFAQFCRNELWVLGRPQKEPPKSEHCRILGGSGSTLCANARVPLILSYLILSYLILSYLVLSCLVLSCLVLSCGILSYFIVSFLM